MSRRSLAGNLSSACWVTQVAEATSQHAYGAEHARLQGELHAVAGQHDAAEQSYLKALAISRKQGARWLELRAARGYAHFLAARQRLDEARAVLSPVLQSITEGKETMDYLYAENLLATL